jgi:hypothetical protein
MVIASARAESRKGEYGESSEGTVTDSGLRSVIAKIVVKPEYVLHRLSAKNKFLAEMNK